MAIGATPDPKKTDAVPTPKVLGFRIPARRSGSVQSLQSTLSGVSFLRVSADAADPAVILALNVQSRDISKNPYVFSILYFRPDAIDAVYTLPPSKSPKARKLEMLKYCLNVLTLCSREYAVDTQYLYQLLEGAVADMNEYVSLDYQELFSKYDSLAGEHDRVLKRIKSLEDSNRELTSDNYNLKNQNQELSLRVASMEKFSDSVLASKIQQWLSEHNGEINLSEFCSVHGVSESRVEQVLNSMVSEGYLESRQ